MPTLVSTGQITIQDVNDVARIVLSADTVALAADASGVVASFAAATTTVQVLQGSTDATSLWTLTKADTSCTSTLSGGTLSVTALSADTGFVVVTAARPGWPTVTARFTVSKAKAGAAGNPGASAVSIVLSNEAHVFPASSAGAVSSYAGSGTTIRVYEGATELTYDGAGTSNGTWRITSNSPTNITVGSYTDSGAYVTIGDHSGVAAGTDTSSIAYTVSGKTSAGTAFTLTKLQTFTKAKAGAAGGPGASAVNVVLTNAAHAVPASSAGAVSSYAGSGTTISMFEGATQLVYDGIGTANGTWKVTALGTNITAGAITDAGANASVADHSAMSAANDTASVGYTITGKTSTGAAFAVSAQQSITKAKAGTAGASATSYWLARSAASIVRTRTGAFSPATITFTAFSQAGAGAPATYAGRFVIETSVDGSTYVSPASYTSAANEASTSFAVLPNTKLLRVSLYAADGTTTLLDVEVIAVVVDGAKNLIDTSWIKVGAAWQWAQSQHGPTTETSIVLAPGISGAVTPLVQAVADSFNKCYGPNAWGANQPSVVASYWFPGEDQASAVAPVVTHSTTGGWTADGSTTYSGNCFVVTKTATSVQSSGIACRAIPVTPGEQLRIRVRVRGGAASSAGLYVRVNQRSAMPASGAVTFSNRTSYTDLLNNGACAATYTTYQTLTYTVPAGITAISLSVFSWANGPAVLYVEDPTVNRVAYTDSSTGLREAAEGGWTADAAAVRVPIDPSKTYRFILPFKRTNSTPAQVYWGPAANHVCTINTATLTANPWMGYTGSAAVGEWHLLVGYVFPAGSTGNTNDGAGVYRVSTGALLASGSNYCWPAGASSCGHRGWQYYADNGASTLFDMPIIEVVDGSEQPLSTYFRPTLDAAGNLVGVGGANGQQVANSRVPMLGNIGSGVGLVYDQIGGTEAAPVIQIETISSPDGSIRIEDSTPASPGIKLYAAGASAVAALEADQAISTTTLTTVLTGLAVEANTAYAVDGVIVYSASGDTTGLKVRLIGPSLSSAVGTFSAQATPSDVEVRPWGSANTLVASKLADYISEIKGVLRTGNAAGTVSLQAAAAAAGTLTIGAGSYITIRKVGAVAVPAVTLPASIGAAATYTQNATRINAPASATQTLSLYGDGTWTITRSAQTSSYAAGTPLSGSWVTPPTAGVGAGYEARCTVMSQSSAVGISNGMPGWTTIGAMGAGVSVYANAAVNNINVASATLKIEIRRLGTTSPVCTSTITFASTVEGMSDA